MYEPSSAPLPTADGSPVAGHFATFALGYVGVQVFTVDFVAADQHRAANWNTKVPSQLTGALIRIWPPLQQVSTVFWPPEAFTKEDWNRLVTWDGALRQRNWPAREGQ
jgi:hypothetical protein